jgi:hypothetical protein
MGKFMATRTTVRRYTSPMTRHNYYERVMTVSKPVSAKGLGCKDPSKDKDLTD